MADETGTAPAGLSSAEAARRFRQRGDARPPQTSRSYASIVRANALTIPNVILVAFGVLTLVFDSWRDALFLGIVVANTVIGSFQEIRSKRELDRLAALIAPQALVVRDGVDVHVPVERSWSATSCAYRRATRWWPTGRWWRPTDWPSTNQT